MKVTYKASDKLSFELEGAGQKEIFKELALIQEIFSEEKCGLCGKNNLRFIVRNVEGNDYYELRCNDCGAVLAFGQHKKGGSVDAGSEFEVVFGVRVVVLIASHEQKSDTQEHGNPHEADGTGAVVFVQRVVRNGQGDAR